MNFFKYAVIAFIILLIAIVTATIFYLPFESEQKITSVKCVESYCTVGINNDYYFTDHASAIQDRYFVGDCVFLGRPTKCECAHKTAYELLMGVKHE